LISGFRFCFRTCPSLARLAATLGCKVMTTWLDLIPRDNPATDARGVDRLAMPYLLVGVHPQAQEASLAGGALSNA
jgi:hypothetical protein